MEPAQPIAARRRGPRVRVSLRALVDRRFESDRGITKRRPAGSPFCYGSAREKTASRIAAGDADKIRTSAPPRDAGCARPSRFAGTLRAQACSAWPTGAPSSIGSTNPVAQQQKGTHRVPLCYWSAREDSNFRPLPPQGSALPGCATRREPSTLRPKALRVKLAFRRGRSGRGRSEALRERLQGFQHRLEIGDGGDLHPGRG